MHGGSWERRAGQYVRAGGVVSGGRCEYWDVGWGVGWRGGLEESVEGRNLPRLLLDDGSERGGRVEGQGGDSVRAEGRGVAER